MRIPSTTAVRDRTAFIGRERELALLLGDLGRDHGLLTITGPSGIGKTRLARQVGQEVVRRFATEGGTWFCNVAACTNPAEVEGAVARMLEIPQALGNDLGSAIASRGKLLLILDNLDSVATGIGRLFEAWLDRCPELQILTTSIVPIEVEGAVRYELGPLEAKDAIALYLERAHRAWAGNSFLDTDQAALEELVGRLDRIPLAIELAAARVRVLPPQTLLSRFSDRFELLHSGRPGRHGSLLSAITLTWEFLSEREQLVLARASVFEGGFSFEAVRAILDPETSELEMLDLLDGLRSKALLQLDDADPPRFRLYESVRDFAARELRSQGLEADARRLHAAYYIGRSEKMLTDLEDPNDREIEGWLKVERENLVAILLRGAETEPAYAARAGIVLDGQIMREGYLPAGLELLELAVEAARRSGDRNLLLRAIRRHVSGVVTRGIGDAPETSLNEGLELARELGNREEEGHLLVLESWRCLQAGDIDRAAALADQAIAIGAEQDQPLLQVEALMNRGEAAYSRLELKEAEAYCSRAITLLRTRHYPLQESRSLNWLAVLWAKLGRFNDARGALQTALVRCRERGDLVHEGNSLLNLGGMEIAAGRLDEAERCTREALRIERELGDRRREAAALGNLGSISLERGDLEEAERLLNQSFGIFQAYSDRRFQAELLPFLAVLDARLGRLDIARARLAEARAYFLEVDDRPNLLVTEILEGSLELAEARAEPPAAHTDVLMCRAVARLEEARAGGDERKGVMAQAIRLVEADLARLERATSDEPPAAAAGLMVGPEAAWFELPGRERVDLRRRVAIRRMFGALVQSRIQTPGVGLEPHALFAVGWPSEAIHPEPALRRVYLGIWTLRDMGLADVLLNRSDGYLLDPELSLHHQAD